MANYTVSNSSSTAYTLAGGDLLTVTSSGQLRPSGPGVTWNEASSGTAAVSNSGVIATTSGRAFDTTGSGVSTASFSLTNAANATITGASDVMRIQKGGFNAVTVDNSGTITASAGRAFNFQEYAGAKTISITNRAGATLQSTDDAIRITTATTHTDVTQNTAFTGAVTITNDGMIKTTGAGSGQALDFADLNATTTATRIVNHGLIQAADADAIRPGHNAYVDNFGQVVAKNATTSSTGNDGVDFQAGGTGVVVNEAGGSITGARHGITGVQPVEVDNTGAITGQLGSGINLDTASNTTATVNNYAGGTITGNAAGSSDGDGVDIDGLINLTNAGTINAFGTWNGGLSEAVTVGGGAIVNNAGGLIYSVQRAITVDDSNGGDAFAATTITNSGTIQGDDGEAISITDTFADTLTNKGVITGSVALGGGNDAVSLYAGSSISGALDGGDGTDAITLYGAGLTSATAGSLGAVVSVETLAVSAGHWTLTASDAFSGGVTIAAGATLTVGAAGGLTASVSDAGLLAFSHSDAYAFSGAISGAGAVEQDGSGVLTLAGHSAYTGGTTISAGGLELAYADAAGTGAITFGAGAHTLVLDAAAVSGGFADTLKGFAHGDTIDLAGVTVSGVDSLAANNTLTVHTSAGDLVVRFDPAQSFSGQVFHTASDGAGGTDVTFADDVAPTAQAGSASGDEDTPIAGQVSATDPDGQALTYAATSGPAHGALDFHADGGFTYTPDANYNGSDSFTFTASDGTLTSAAAAESLTINPVEDAPTAHAGTGAGDEDTQITGQLAATDPDAGDTLTYALAAGPAHGAVAVHADGGYVYTPDANYNGSDSFTFTASDGTLTSAAAAESLTINPVEDAPTAADITGAVAEHATTPIVLTPTASDPDAGDTLTYTVDTTGTKGQVTVNGDGTFSYAPNGQFTSLAAGATTTDIFAYTADDGHGGTATAHAVVTITGQDDAPTAVALSATSVNENSPQGTVVATLTTADPDAGDSFTYTLDDPSGAFAISGDHLVVAGPIDYETRNAYDITVTSTDSGGLSVAHAAHITVNDEAADTIYGAAGDDSLSFNPAAQTASAVDGLGGFDTLTLASGVSSLSAQGGSLDLVLTPDGAALTVSHVERLVVTGDTLVAFGDLTQGGLAPGQTLIFHGEANSPDGDHVDATGLTASVGLQAFGGQLADVLRGGAGDDLLAGGAGGDTLDGGAGTDTASYAASGAGVAINLGKVVTDPTGTYATGLNGDATGDRLYGIENLIGSSAADSLTGGAGANLLDGGAGADSLNGGAGNDTLIGGDGNDTLNGAAGLDTASYASAASAVTVSLAHSGAQDTHGAGVDTLIGIENLTGSDHGDALTGSSSANLIVGGAGNDTLDGGAGADTLAGGQGDDVYYVDNANDRVVEAVGQGHDTVYVSISTFILGAGQEVETLVANGAAPLALHGNEFAQLLVGNDAADTLDGGAGADTLQGGLGDDTYILHNLGQHIVEAPGGGVDTVKTDLAGYALDDNLEVLTYTGTGAFAGTGNSLDNTITGGAGNDTLDGGAGADRLIGLGGGDTYHVDNANDQVVEAANGGHDQVIATLSSYTLGANVEDLFFGGSGAFIGTGNALANTINADLASEATLHGGAGADTIIGSGGNDVISGDQGGDFLVGGGGANTFVYARTSDSSAATGIDTIADLKGGVDTIDLRSIDASTKTAGDQAFHLVSAFTHNPAELLLTYNATTHVTMATGDVNGDGAADFQINLSGDHHDFTGFLL